MSVLEYDTKQSDGEAPVILELWGMQSTPLLSSIPGSLWSGVVALDRALYTGEIELNTVRKVGDLCRGRPEGSLFNSNYTEV